MKTFHEFVDKSTAPIQGNIYHVHLHGQEVYSAEITQYKKGDSFEVKVAQYIFTLIES